jgi:hypothetical protein
MSQAMTLRRSSSLRAGIVGAALGAAMAFAAVYAVATLSPGTVGDTGARSSAIAPIRFQEALQAHLSREYGTPVALGSDIQAALREHVARENGLPRLTAGLGIDFASGLREHVARENASIVSAASSGIDARQSLIEHVLRENR